MNIFDYKFGQMVDFKRRKALALNLRHLSVGLITNDEFENKILEEVSFGWLPEQYYRAKQAKNDDALIVPMLNLSWGLYSDLKEHKLKAEYKLPDKSLKIIAHCILFLQSGLEYEWPYFDYTHPILKFSIKDMILFILTIGNHYRKKKARMEIAYKKYMALGDYDYWPFLKLQDYQAQLKNQPFLTGKSSVAS